jgi:tetratricopeptide (TPR) repeat protein
MTHRRMKIGHVLLAAALALPAIAGAQVPAAAVPAPQTSAAATEPSYLEGRRLFESLDYENAVRALDHAVAALQASPDPASRDLLVSAYEMRARSKFGLGDASGATADFVSLLRINPAHTLTGQVSPRVVALFDEAVAAHVTALNLSVTPPTARVELDGREVKSGLFKVTVGDHVIAADQQGYRRDQRTVAAAAGAVAEVSITLERVSAVLNVLTVPAEVDVTVDGVSVGRTAAGPPPPQYADAIARANAAGQPVSAVLSVADVTTGGHVIQFSRDCHVAATNKINVDKPADYTVGPIVLAPATARLSVTASAPDAQVFLDGEARGTAPFSLPGLCAGPHTVEVRSRTGHFSARIEAKAGETINLDAVLKPAFALTSTAGPGAAATDVRPLVERALAAVRTVTVFAPPADRTKELAEANRLPADWLAFDATGRSLSPTAQIVQTLRADASTKLAEALNAQGVASVTLLGDNRMVLALLAAGSSIPDILEMRLDRPESIAAVVERLDRPTALSRPTIGVTTIDVADVSGAIVVGTDPKTAPGIAVGDIIVGVGGQPLADASALSTLVAGRAANDVLTLDLRSAEGATKQAKLTVSATPRVISLFDPTILSNRVLLDMRARLAGAKDPIEQATIRLNLAVALARSGEWNDAREELQRIQLPAGTGVSDGTVQYLLGLAADRLGNRADAEAALKKAAAAGGLVTEDGPAVRELAEARLAEMQQAPR